MGYTRDPCETCGDEAERVKPKKTYAKLRVGRWPAFFEYKDARVYGFDFLMRAESDRIYGCLACASAFGEEKVPSSGTRPGGTSVNR